LLLQRFIPFFFYHLIHTNIQLLTTATFSKKLQNHQKSHKSNVSNKQPNKTYCLLSLAKSSGFCGIDGLSSVSGEPADGESLGESVAFNTIDVLVPFCCKLGASSLVGDILGAGKLTVSTFKGPGSSILKSTLETAIKVARPNITTSKTKTT
jgi:hypothetical protein